MATPRPAGLRSWWPSAFSSSRTCALMVWTAMSSPSATRAKPLFLGDDPAIIEIAVVQHIHLTSEKQKFTSCFHCFIRI